MEHFRPFGDALILTRTTADSVRRLGATGRGQLHARIEGDMAHVERGFWFDAGAGMWVDIDDRFSCSLAELAADRGAVATHLERWFGRAVRAEAVRLAAARLAADP